MRGFSPALRLGALLLLLPLLLGCSPPRAEFHATDVSGADFGRDLRLRDSAGNWRTLAEFRGKAVMVFFGFTQCPAVCPTALLNAAEVRRGLGAEGEKVQVLFVTLDPERDTPALLHQYAGAFDPSFIALYGNLEETKAVAQEFRVFYQKVATGDSYTVDHSALTYIYDRQGRLRLVVSHSQAVADTISDLRSLLRS